MANQNRGNSKQVKRERGRSLYSNKAIDYFEGSFCQVSLMYNNLIMYTFSFTLKLYSFCVLAKMRNSLALSFIIYNSLFIFFKICAKYILTISKWNFFKLAHSK